MSEAVGTFLDECNAHDILSFAPSEIQSIHEKVRSKVGSTRSWVEAVARHVSREDSKQIALLIGNATALRPQLAVSLIRKHGLLRASKCGFNFEAFSATLDGLGYAYELNLVDDEVEEYRKSVLALHQLAGFIRVARRRTAKRLSSDPSWFLGSLQTLDFLFARQIMRLDHGGPPLRSIELRGEAFSTLCSLDGVLEQVVLHEGNFGPDIKRIVDGEYLDEIDRAIPLRMFNEWERLVDLFSYRCTSAKAGFRVSPPNPRIERSIRLGYMQSIFSKQHFNVVDGQSQFSSYSEVLESLEELARSSGKAPIVESIPGIHSRYRLNIPDIPDLWKLVGSIPVFREEQTELSVMCDAFAVDAENLLQVKVNEQVTLRDVLVFHRVLSLFAEATRQQLRSDVDTDLPKVLRSLAPAAPTRALHRILSYATSDAVADSLLELFTASTLSYFDVQYRPLIRVRDRTLLPLNIVSASALIRNVLQVTNRRIDHAGRDPEEQLIVSAFEASGAYAKSNIEYRSGGGQFEIDVLAIVESTLIVIEVKRGLLPTNTKELQTTYEAAHSAADQLDRVVQHLTDPARRRAIQTEFGRDISAVTQVLTCIALTNRMLSGHRIGQHPIRGSRELASFVVDGTTSLIAPGIEVTGRYRSSGNVTGEQLADYLIRDVLHNDFFDSMKRHDFTYSLPPTCVFVESAVLHHAEMKARLAARV